MLKVKAGVTPKLLRIAAGAANVAELLGLEITITSGNDGKHMKGSKHYTYEALDFRTRDLSKTNVTKVMTMLRGRLGPHYDVILEHDHLHVEYQE